METGIITYNLGDRGREYRGKKRNFHNQRIAELINSPVIQEQIRNRDMLGFYGHWPRLAFGLEPREGGIVNRKVAVVEPALVTTLLDASPDGTIRHRAEFLETASGKVAQALFKSRTGGFSSAIDEEKPGFYGFDYVLEPNYTTNRGYTLDSAKGMETSAILDAVREEQAFGLQYLLDCATAREEVSFELIERLQAENEELLSLLATPKSRDQGVLDSVYERPLAISQHSANRLLEDIQTFRSAPLPSVLPLDDSPPDPLVSRIYQRLGVRR
jgi:hypothetical protein